MKRGFIIAFVMLSAVLTGIILPLRPAPAAEAEMPVTVTIVVCPRDDLRNACDRETRCCYLLEGEDGNRSSSGSGPSSTPPMR